MPQRQQPGLGDITWVYGRCCDSRGHDWLVVAGAEAILTSADGDARQHPTIEAGGKGGAAVCGPKPESSGVAT